MHHTTSKKTFLSNLPKGFEVADDPVADLLLREYGSVFVARGGAVPPPMVIFENDIEVTEFQNRLDKATAEIGGIPITLQAPAMDALLAAAEQARGLGLNINPRGADSGARSYEETIVLWKSRVEPGLEHWTKRGRIGFEVAERIRALTPFQQVHEILALESDGIFFSKDLSKSIIYSVAPPGSSQHLSLLAMDVAEFDDQFVRGIMAEHFWYQTVVSDLPHFTFLGAAEGELPDLGLKRVESGGRAFWVPDL